MFPVYREAPDLFQSRRNDVPPSAEIHLISWGSEIRYSEEGDDTLLILATLPWTDIESKKK